MGPADFVRGQWIEVFTKDLPDDWIEQYIQQLEDPSPSTNETWSPLPVIQGIVLLLALFLFTVFAYLRLSNPMTLLPKSLEQKRKNTKWATFKETVSKVIGFRFRKKKKEKPASPLTKKDNIYETMVKLGTEQRDDGALLQLLSSKKPLKDREKAFPADFPCVNEKLFHKGTVPRYIMTTKAGEKIDSE